MAHTARLSVLSAATALVGTAFAGSLLVPAQAANGNGAGSPFDDSEQRIFASKSSNQGDPTGLYELTPGPSSYSFSSIGGDADLVYNALTFNPDDNYLYAISGDGKQSGVPAGSLLKIGSQGNYEVVGNSQYTDPNVNSKQIYLGAIDTDSDTYYVMNGDPDNPSQLIEVPLGGGSSPGSVSLSSTWNNVNFGSDITFSKGYLWALGDTNLVRIDPSNGDVDTYPVPSGANSSNGDQAGAAWTFFGGDLGFSYNGTGTVVRIRVANAGGTPTFTVISSKSGSGSGQNDGAAIPGHGIDLAITKTGQLTDNGTKASWTLTGTNNGPGTATGWTITDTLPSGLTGVTATGDGDPQVNGTTVTASDALLDEGDKVVVTITATLGADAPDSLPNIGKITGPDVDPNPANNTATVTLTTPATTSSSDDSDSDDSDSDDSDSDDSDSDDKKLPGTGAPTWANPWLGGGSLLLTAAAAGTGIVIRRRGLL